MVVGGGGGGLLVVGFGGGGGGAVVVVVLGAVVVLAVVVVPARLEVEAAAAEVERKPAEEDFEVLAAVLLVAVLGAVVSTWVDVVGAAGTASSGWTAACPAASAWP